MTLILSPTHSKYEPWCDTLVKLMDQMWPGHPELWFLTDGNGIRHPNTLSFAGANWTQILHRGLLEIRSRYPELKYVYLILEDLFPLGPCDTQLLDRTLEVAQRAKLDVVLFFTEGCLPDVDSEVTVEGLRLRPLSGSFRYHSSLQPALWRLDYLLEVTAHAMAQGITDPWAFEFINLGRRHYKSPYHWPCVFSGLFFEGRVNWPAIGRIQAREFSAFRFRLLALYLRQWPGYRFRTIFGKLRRGVARAVRALA
jgi:hypothetical protein